VESFYENVALKHLVFNGLFVCSTLCYALQINMVLFSHITLQSYIHSYIISYTFSYFVFALQPKGIFHPKKEIRHHLLRLMLFQTHKTFFLLYDAQKIFMEI